MKNSKIVYNVTVNIDETIHQEWLEWIHHHIKEVLATNLFEQARFCEVLMSQEAEGITYSIQYTAKSEEDLNDYYQNHAPKLRLEGAQKFGDRMLAFRTELKIIEDFLP